MKSLVKTGRHDSNGHYYVTAWSPLDVTLSLIKPMNAAFPDRDKPLHLRCAPNWREGQDGWNGWRLTSGPLTTLQYT